MSKFLDSLIQQNQLLNPSLSSSYITPKLTSLGVESEGRFRRVVLRVFGIQKRLRFAGFRRA